MPTSARWGKRPREGDGDEAFVRFSELSPAQKLERRRRERTEKKEQGRTLAYFRSVQHALEEQSSGGGDAGVLASIVDGFFSELLKLLKADSTLYILRNGTACRVVELALANALLLHIKSLLYIFLGHICELLISPVASYTLETLLASLSQGLSALADTDADGLDAELAEGGVGIHTGSGVPSSATLLSSMAEELCEHTEDLIVHDIGGRALRSVILMLGGRSIRQAPLPARPVAFPRVLGALAESVIKAVEEGYGREYQTASPAEAWMAAVQSPPTSLVVQSLLRVSEEGTVVDRCIRQRIEQLTYKGKSLLHHFLTDALGCHVFQSYLQVPPPTAVVVEGDAAVVRASASEESSLSSSEATPVPGGEASCCWSRAAGTVIVEINNLLKPGSDLVAQAGYVLQDLVLYAPTATHLQWLWRRALEPRLALMFDVPALTPVLVQMVKRCAFEGVVLTPTASSGSADIAIQAVDAAASATGEESHHGTVLPADVLAMLRKEAAQHVRYSPVPITLQASVCKSVCALAKQRVAKGAAQYFLVDAVLGDKGYDVARFLLHLHPTASTMLQYSLDKLQRDDLLGVLCHHKGSRFMQQYIKVSALTAPKSAAAYTAGGQVDRGNGAADAAAAASGMPLMRLLRRLQSSLGTLLYNKYAAFVLEGLYEAAPMPVKEALVKSLVPLYQEMRTQSSTADPASAEAAVSAASETAADEAGESAECSSPSPTQERFIAYKVMSRCCVEQYVHRKGDWVKLAERQCNVQRLLRRMLLSE
ncbi:hypothetical protein LSCM1_04615 [Leishmania martiniquensis]|uniref:Uncharacterized protein n=1 Tax=Leishmania martiniquensis TaxID=1580590 RepID=A0A836H4H8_9TRYP|nr:hypothetical protein LSCM1_04615 [Leishmania martiniquensis]